MGLCFQMEHKLSQKLGKFKHSVNVNILKIPSILVVPLLLTCKFCAVTVTPVDFSDI